MNVIFEPDRHCYGYYECKSARKNSKLAKIITFFSDEAIGIENWWIKFLNNNHNLQDEWLGNILYLRKDAPKVFIGWCITAEDPFPDPDEYETTIEQLVAAIEAWNTLRDQKPAKIILEVDLLNERQIKTATQTICKVANEENAKLVIKTKTGFTENKTSNLSAIQIIRRTLEELNQYGEDKIRIKASGGIRTKEEALQLLQAGAHILGVGKGAEIMGAVS